MSKKDSGPPDSIFAARLKELRTEAGLSQAKLAANAGMSLAGVTQLEQGLRQPTWVSIQALADALGVATDAFRSKAKPRPRAGKGRPRKAGE